MSPYYNFVANTDTCRQRHTAAIQVHGNNSCIRATVTCIRCRRGVTVVCTHIAPCNVEIQSVGYWESECTYVKINRKYAVRLTSPADENDAHHPSGTYTVLLDKVSL